MLGAKKTIEIWGSGKPIRDFLYSDDFADSAVFALEGINFGDLLVKIFVCVVSASERNFAAAP